MKKKIKDLTLNEFFSICKKYKGCCGIPECPLHQLNIGECPATVDINDSCLEKEVEIDE